jgi:predicted PolB exonuclease-like 3'-5' exonuclease
MYRDMDTNPIVVDIETVGLPNAADFLEPVQAAKNLVDPAKIQADIEKRTAERDEKLALDWNVGRIAVLAWWTERDGYVVRPCADEAAERMALEEFWQDCKHRTIVGFNIKGFDLRFMVQRSRYLGLAYPMLDFSKYSRKGITDLYLDLTFNDGTYDQGAMRRTLHAFCKRFGIPVQDTVRGADVPKLVAVGDWESVTRHALFDVAATVKLAQRLGIVAVEPEQVAV